MNGPIKVTETGATPHQLGDTDMTLAKPLTATERFLLNEVYSVPEYAVSVDTLRHSVRHLTRRGFQTVVSRLLTRNLLVWSEVFDGTVELTFSGMLSLRGGDA